MRAAAVALALAGAAGLLARLPPPVEACTPAPSPDPVAASDVIVAGRIISWQVATDVEAPTPVTPDSYQPVPIRLYMEVDRAYKGPATTHVDFLNKQSLEFWDGRYSWTFATFACGDFRDSPTGTYAVIGLRNEGGHLEEVARFFQGQDGEGAEFEEATSRLGPGYLPAAGGEPATGGSPATMLEAALAGAVAVVAVVVLAVALGRRARV